MLYRITLTNDFFFLTLAIEAKDGVEASDKAEVFAASEPMRRQAAIEHAGNGVATDRAGVYRMRDLECYTYGLPLVREVAEYQGWIGEELAPGVYFVASGGRG